MTETILPPPIIERYEYPVYEKETDPNGNRQYITPSGNLTSVTTILSATKDMTVLDAWRERIGDEEADRQIKVATSAGNLMHESVENFLLGVPRKNGSNMIHKMARKMADNIINRGIVNVDEVWGVEVPLYFPHAYAGTTDLVGVYNGAPAIMDHKNAKKIKKREWIEDYFMQGAAYSLAHNELYNTNIKQVVIFMSSRDYNYQTFIIEGNEYLEYCDKWIKKLDDYFNLMDKK